MSSLHRELGFGELPVLGVYAVLFANFFGTVVVIWSIVRLVSDDPRLGIHDGIARLAFSTWMIVALFSGATPLIWFFLVPEITFGVLQLTGLTKSLNRAWQA
ncbi:hypothetical protein [uncultured Nitratireductor sp.]|uniref:hypothetical protein n=1 Tax=uncultured Nitratireductor sp. TaxID=520953 RepID=UPI0025E6BFC4|nr:hypothetical protein [uncultured Nitratireductor sp.]